VAAVTAVFAAGTDRAAGATERWAASGVFVMAVGSGLALTVRSFAARARAWLERAPARALAAGWLGWLAFYTAGALAFERTVPAAVPRLALVGLAAIALWAWRPAPGARGPAAPDRAVARGVAAALLLWLAAGFGIVRGVRLPWSAAHGVEVSEQLVLDLAVWLFVAARPVPGVGWRLAAGPRALALAALAFVAYAAVAAPLGLALGFLHAGVSAGGGFALATRALRIYAFVALPEEFLFRGLIQNALARRWISRPTRAWLLASVVFGLAHAGHPPAPNWRYALLAGLAGLAYGFVWRRTRSIGAAALTHAAVDFAWSTVFAG
jgi:CAAX protease family protein